MINNILKNEYENIVSNINADDLKNKSILITGANGLIASYLVDILCFLNNEKNFSINIYALSRSKEKSEKRFYNQNINIIEQDLNIPFDSNIHFDYIIHAASNSHPLAFSSDPVGTMKTNLLGTINLLEIAKKSGAKFLYFSTGEIYGNNIDHAFTEDDLGLVDTKIARSCYPESKRAAETLCMAYRQQFNINVNIARFCYVYGSTITDTNSRADAQFLRKALAGENIILKSAGLQKRTYCYVADAVSAILCIILNGTNGEVYNVANPNSVVSVKEYAETLANLANVELVFELPNEPEKRGYSKQADSILDAKKLINLGWKPIYKLKDGLNNTLLIKREEINNLLKEFNERKFKNN